MTLIEVYSGRKFIESEYYPPISRFIAGLSSNKIWLYSVDKCYEVNRDTGEITDKIIIRIVRWQARNDKSNKNLKYWRARSSYNVRSSEEWIATSELVNVMIDENMENPNFIIIPQEEYNQLKDDKSETLDLIQKIKKLRTEKSAGNAQLDIFKKRFN